MRPVRPRVHAWLHAQVTRTLADRLAPLQQLRDETARTVARAEDAERVLAAVSARADRLAEDLDLFSRPFSADMTVDRAWRRHPGTAAIFARHHLPACDGCAVRFDETLEEAAQAYGLHLGTVLAELNALLDPAKDPPHSS